LASSHAADFRPVANGSPTTAKRRPRVRLSFAIASAPGERLARGSQLPFAGYRAG
jgi:hypothetical protein